MPATVNDDNITQIILNNFPEMDRITHIKIIESHIGTMQTYNI